MLKAFLDKIFKLPPVEQRPDIRRSFIKKVVCPITAAVSDKDDTYIYYQFGLSTLMISLLLAIPFALAYGLDQSIDFYFLTVNVPDVDTMAVVFKQYVSVTQSLLLYGLFPFFLIKFRWNVNPKKYDVLWPSSLYAGRGRRSRWYVIPRVMFAIIVYLFPYKFIYLMPQAWHLEGTQGLLFFQFITAYALTLLTLAFFIGTIILWRYIGKYEGR